MQNCNTAALTKTQEKLEYNRRMIGKRIYVLRKGGYFGEVVSVVNSETLEVRTDKGNLEKVDIFDIRSAD